MFFLNMHHIISDYLSHHILIEEMLALYEAYAGGNRNFLTPLPIQYKDYVVWHNKQLQGKQLKEHREYWLHQLGGYIPRLELTLDPERSPIQTYNGDNLDFTVAGILFEKLKSFSETHHVTLFMTLFAALNLLFYYYSGQQDIVLGTVIAGREHEYLLNQVGYYLNTLAIRTGFDSGDTFIRVLNKVKIVLNEAYQHQAYPFNSLVEDLGNQWDASRHPVFDVLVNMLNYKPYSRKTLNPGPGNHIRFGNFEIKTQVSKFDLTIYLFEGEQNMGVTFQYNTDLFERSTIERMIHRFQQLLHTVLKEPASIVSKLKLEQKSQAPRIKSISSNS